MEKTIKNGSKGRYLLIRTKEQEETYEDRMIRSIEISSILMPFSVYEDGRHYSRYDITGLRPFDEYLYNKEIKADEIKKYITQLSNTSDRLSNYLLSEENLIIEQGTVFIEEESRMLFFCIGSGAESRNFQSGLRYFAGELIAHADPHDMDTMAEALLLYKTVREKGVHMYDVMNALFRRDTIEKKTDDIAFDAARYRENAADSKEEMPENNAVMYSENESRNQFINQYKEKPDDRFREQFIEEPEKDDTAKSLLIKAAVSVGIMLAAMAVIFVIRGITAVKRVLPLFAVLTVCVTAYMVVETIVENKKKKAELS